MWQSYYNSKLPKYSYISTISCFSLIYLKRFLKKISFKDLVVCPFVRAIDSLRIFNYSYNSSNLLRLFCSCISADINFYLSLSKEAVQLIILVINTIENFLKY